MSNVIVGTSGFRFHGERKFYPKGLAQDRYIEYYARYFDAVEINATYYSIPKPETFERFVRLTPDHFMFTIKVPKTVTHERVHPRVDIDDFREAIAPVVEAGKLDSLLAQFPLSFRYSMRTLDFLRRLPEILYGHKVYVEFRHRDWIRDNVFRVLAEQGMGIVSVDEPDLPDLLPDEFWSTDNTIYYRLHSRDASKWYSGRDARYDYFYSDDELRGIKSRLNRETKDKLRALVFFNNCHQGSAMKNAEKLKLMLGQDSGPQGLGL